MKFFFHYIETNQRIELDVTEEQTIKDLKSILDQNFALDCNLIKKRLVFEYSGSDLNDQWYLIDLPIPVGSTIKIYLKDETNPDLYVYVKFQKETINFYDIGLDLSNCSVLELRVFIQNNLGFPLSIFRLKTQSNIDLYDENYLHHYDITYKSTLILETWQGWDNFLQLTIKGYSKLVLKSLSQDDFIKQYQLKVALYIASFNGNFDLAKILMAMGARVDKPVGEHPCRQWCQVDPILINKIDKKNKIEYLKLEHLKCPIHAAVLNGQLKILTLIAKTNIHLLETKDGYGVPPWRLALRNNHKDILKNVQQKDVARFLLTKQFGGKVKLMDNFNISISLYSKIRSWIDRAKEKVLLLYGIGKSSLKKRPFHKGNLVGNKVLIDGFNNNFKDYMNSYERLKSKYKYYYFISQEEKDKHGYLDLYFKTIGLINKNQNSKSHQNQFFTSQKKNSFQKYSVRIETKSALLWRKALNKILFIKTIKNYLNILIGLGVELDLTMFKVLETEDDKENKDPVGSRSKAETPNERNMTKEISKLPLLKEKNLTLVKNKYVRSAKREPKGESRLPSISNSNVNNKQQQEFKKKREKTPEKLINSVDIYNASVNYFETRYNKIKRFSKEHKDNLFNSREDFQKETIDMFIKYRNGIKQYDNAKTLLENANTFKSKSWLQQVNLASQIAKTNARRLIKQHSQNHFKSESFVY